MAIVSPYLSIISLNINGLTLIKRHRVADWILKKQDWIKCHLQGTHYSFKVKHRLKVKGWKKIFYANENQKRIGVVILVPDKTDNKPYMVTRDKKIH